MSEIIARIAVSARFGYSLVIVFSKLVGGGIFLCWIRGCVTHENVLKFAIRSFLFGCMCVCHHTKWRRLVNYSLLAPLSTLIGKRDIDLLDVQTLALTNMHPELQSVASSVLEVSLHYIKIEV